MFDIAALFYLYQNQYIGMLSQVTALMGPGGSSAFEEAIQKLEQLKGLIDMVCSFLSLYVIYILLVCS